MHVMPASDGARGEVHPIGRHLPRRKLHATGLRYVPVRANGLRGVEICGRHYAVRPSRSASAASSSGNLNSNPASSSTSDRARRPVSPSAGSVRRKSAPTFRSARVWAVRAVGAMRAAGMPSNRRCGPDSAPPPQPLHRATRRRCQDSTPSARWPTSRRRESS